MNDPKKYREMCVPFESIESANEALEGFQKELYDLRVKYRIRDVSVAMAVDIVAEGAPGGEFTARIASHIGSSRVHVELAAYALGEARAESEHVLRALETLGKKSRGERK